MPSVVDLLPPEFEGRDSFVKFGDVAALAKSYQESEKMNTRILTGVQGPGIVALLRKNGLAGEGENDYPIPEGAPPDVARALKSARAVAAESGVTKAAWAKLVESSISDRTSKLEKWKAESKQIPEAELAKAMAVIQAQFNDEGLSQAISEAGLSQHPRFLKALAALHRPEDYNLPGDTGKMSPESEAKELAQFLAKGLSEKFYMNPHSAPPEEKPRLALLRQEIDQKTKRLQELGYTGVLDPRLGVQNPLTF